MACISILFFLGVSFSGGLGEGPAWLATCSECCFRIFLFFCHLLSCGGYFLDAIHSACVPVGGMSQKEGTDQCELVSCTPKCQGFCLLQSLLHNPKKARLFSLTSSIVNLTYLSILLRWLLFGS